MKIFLLTFIITFTATADTTLKWVGQFPSEQAGPVVEKFNSLFSQQYGFKVDYKYDEKVIADLLGGKNNLEYDIVHMKDADMLNTLGKTDSVQSIELESTRAWPLQMRDADNRWVALLKRFRIIYYNIDLVQPDEVKSYESLADSKFKDRLCLRQKKAQYTSGLNSFLLATWGEEKFTAIAKAWASNAENIPLLEKDLDHVIAKVESGECIVGVANTYYYTRHLAAKPDTRVKPALPDQNSNGAHVNIDGIALLKTSTQVTQAKIFVTWLISEEAQLLLSDITGKHPANPSIKSTRLDNVFGEIKVNSTFDLNKITDFKARAFEIVTELGFK